MKLGCVDVETFYDNQYSLSKLTTEEYIRDPRFQVIGVSVFIEGWDAPRWFSGTHEEIRNWLLAQVDWNDVGMVAHNAMFDMAILNWVFGIRPKVIFDTLSMSRPIHGLQVGGSLKTLAAHYGIGEKGEEVHNFIGYRREDFQPGELAAYGRYCCNDVALAYSLFKIMAPNFNKEELKVIDLTIRMFSEPVLTLNKDKLEKHLEGVKQRKKALLKDVLAVSLGADATVESGTAYAALLGEEEAEQQAKKILMSNDKLAELLKTRGVEPPTKISPTTGKTTFAFAKTDEAFKALAEHEDEFVQSIVAARLGVKSTLEETRTQRFIGIAERGTLPVPIKYYGAHTGRFSAQDLLNMQNLPARGANGGKLKSCIEASDGHWIIDCDSAQIEVRCLAWLAGQQDLVDAFFRKEDIYSNMATDIYGRPINRKLMVVVNGEETFPDAYEGHVGKATVLGAGYGMGPARFVEHAKAAGVSVTLEQAKHIIAVYRAKYKKIVALWYQAQECLEAMINKWSVPKFGNGAIQFDPDRGFLLPNGFWMGYHNLRRVQVEGKWEFMYDQKKGRGLIPTRIHGPKVIENLTQGVARCVVTHQMVKISQEFRVILPVHDANAVVAPIPMGRYAQEYVEKCMRIVPPWGTVNGISIPLDCESSMTKQYL